MSSSLNNKLSRSLSADQKAEIQEKFLEVSESGMDVVCVNIMFISFTMSSNDYCVSLGITKKKFQTIFIYFFEWKPGRMTWIKYMLTIINNVGYKKQQPIDLDG